MRSHSTPPGPGGLWLVGNLPQLTRDVFGFLTASARTYGDVVYLRLGQRPTYLVNRPELIESVLVYENDAYAKYYGLTVHRSIFGQGLLTSEGALWRRQRHRAQPAFYKSRLQVYAGRMLECGEEAVSGWVAGAPIDVRQAMAELTIRVVLRTLFGGDLYDHASEITLQLDRVMGLLNSRLRTYVPFPEAVPTPGNVRIRRALGRLDDLIYGYIERKRRGSGTGDDLIALLSTDARGNDDPEVTDRQLRDEIMTFLVGGHENVSNVLAWAFHLLARHPEAEARLVEELRGVLGGRPPEAEDLQRLPYLEGILLETMRLFPPVWIFGRDAIRPTLVGGYRIPRGATVLMSQWVVHRDPEHFDEPEAFRPERWQGGLARRLPRYAYFPFGGGPRVCIGAAFSMTEASLLLGLILQRYSLRHTRAVPVRPHPGITLRPRGRLMMRAVPR